MKRQNKSLKRLWEIDFQFWVDQQTEIGAAKCGRSEICKYCLGDITLKPCAKALNKMCKRKEITIDYTNTNYEEIWESGRNERT